MRQFEFLVFLKPSKAAIVRFALKKECSYMATKSTKDPDVHEDMIEVEGGQFFLWTLWFIVFLVAPFAFGES